MLGDCQFLTNVIIEPSGFQVLDISLDHDGKSDLVSGAFWEEQSSLYYLVIYMILLD